MRLPERHREGPCRQQTGHRLESRRVWEEGPGVRQDGQVGTSPPTCEEQSRVAGADRSGPIGAGTGA